MGTYILLAALNRALAPTSQAQLAALYQSTALSRWLPVQPRQLTSQRFWDHMSYLDAAAISRIETELSTRLIQEFQLDLRCLLYDATNFVTYMDSANPSELAQRGHSKAGRGDLKQVNLALLVTLDFHIPLFHQVYPGDIPDSMQLASVTADLVQRYQTLQRHCQDITLIYDKGNNARRNQEQLDASPFHFVGSLVPSQHADLLAIPWDRFENLGPSLGGEKAFRTTKSVLGKERTVVVTYNESLFAGQHQRLSQHLKKAVQGLRQLQKQLATPRRGGKPPTLAATQKQVDQLLAPQHLRQLLNSTLTASRRCSPTPWTMMPSRRLSRPTSARASSLPTSPTGAPRTLSGPTGVRAKWRQPSVIVAEIGDDMDRFPSAGHLASWAGMCPGNHESAGKRKSGKTRKGSP